MPNYGHLSLSCYIFERVNKGRKPPKRDLAGRGTRIPKGSVSHCRSRIHRALSHIATNAATFVSRGCGGYTLAFANRIAHNGSHGETRGVSDGGEVSLPSERFAWFGNPAWPGVRAANFAVLGSWPGALPKNAESLRNSDALMRVAVPRRRGPAGLRDLFRFCRNCGLYALRSGPFRVCEARGSITTLSALYVLLKRRTAAC